ncbi:PorP/SprF family type IX secretion system membrane protein [Pedobacter punctiformis]|uniref:PorP/SprF family type IX secretion system membrane protein n=1 Tax=Pedobacter punctiformis TaxID=3004097 RepID=A0ABT4L992_9SPHI|nr:PorP/SprF family type IX secretion system membrane protein [Pedobacter sp. HCMS5-2]MCZ4243753.1 PorP/SprF family type IX secretion system membrane protein [Pedobacter sp. HCMS5-2]
MYKTLFSLLLCLITVCCSAQDPKFSQYFASPLTLNPAYTGFFDGDYRFAVNTRQQWGNLGDPYNTYSVSGDLKLIQDENFTNSVFSIGLSGLFDESFNKALKSQYISASFSYYQYLDIEHRFKFGLAPQISYVSKYLDYNKLTFASQYDEDGHFDMSLPNHLDLKNDRTSYFDLNLGGNFSATFNRLSLALGYSFYHISKPRENMLNGNEDIVPYRRTIHLSMLYKANELVDLNFSGISLAQRANRETIVGGVVGFRPNEETKIKVNAGLWYKFNQSAVYPYLGLSVGNITAGLNYTVAANKMLNNTPRTYEISLIYTHNNSKGYKLACPKF